MPSPKDRQRIYQQKHYSGNKQYYKDKRSIRKKELQHKLADLKSRLCCCLCPENDPPALDFHHYDREQKESLVPRMIQNGTSWDKILVEIRKCVCLCANCHRKVHTYPEWANKLSATDCIIVD